MNTQPTNLEAAIAAQIAAEEQLENAQRRLNEAANPLTRAFGRIGVWAARGNAEDSAEHVDMLAHLQAMEQRGE